MKPIQRTHALTTIAPLRPLRLWWCRILLPILRIGAISSSLARFRFIHYGGWLVFGRLPRRRLNRTPSGWRPRPTMLFMSDYDGDPTEYLAAFGVAAAPGMRWSFGSAVGFPGPQPTQEFIDYVERHRVDHLLHYSAYPDATVRDVDVALDMAYRIKHVNALPDKDSDSNGPFEIHHRALLRALAQAPEPPKPSLLTSLWNALWNRSTVSGFTTLMPIDATREDEIVAGIETLAHDPESLFKSVGGVHFARLAILPVPARRPRRTDQAHAGDPTGHTRPCLLFSAWFDGDRRDFVNRLVTGLGHHADVIWDGCDGYPGTDDPQRLGSWITAHRLRISLFLGSRSGPSAEQIQDALKLEQQVRELLTATQGQPLPEIRRALPSDRAGVLAIPRENRDVNVDVYLDTDDDERIDVAISEVERLVEVLGYESWADVSIERGSIFKRSKAKSQGTLSPWDMQLRLAQLEQALSLRLVQKEQAEMINVVSAAVARLIDSLAEIPYACVRIDDYVVVKVQQDNEPVISSRKLNGAELRAIERCPEIEKTPDKFFDLLAMAVDELDPPDDIHPPAASG